MQQKDIFEAHYDVAQEATKVVVDQFHSKIVKFEISYKLPKLLDIYYYYYLFGVFFAAGKLTQVEDREEGSVKLSTYSNYLKSAGGNNHSYKAQSSVILVFILLLLR